MYLKALWFSFNWLIAGLITEVVRGERNWARAVGSALEVAAALLTFLFFFVLH